uniref:Putative peritrophin-48 n=1 Tax=Haematobia irritans TaxID=7368 RepID=A0A1L8EIN2_HAEIR
MKTKVQLCVTLSLMALSQCMVVPRIPEPETEYIQNTHTLCKGRYNGTKFAHTEDCHKFYVCNNNEAEIYNCDKDYHFDKQTLSCITGSDCNDDELTTPSTCSEGNKRAVDGDCYIFEICINGQYQKLQCGPGLYFFAPSSSCKPIKYNADYKCSCVVPERTIMTNHDNCETYYSCEAKKAKLIQCPLGQYYNSTMNSCMVDVYHICLMEPTKTPDLQSPIANARQLKIDGDMKLSALCAHQALMGKSEMMFQHHDTDCSKFLVCVNGILHVQQCPQDHFFDIEKEYCILDTEKRCLNNSPKHFSYHKTNTRFIN